MKLTMKAFREWMNRTYGDYKWKHNQFKQRTRKYGDYLYHQDKDKFLVEYAEWVKNGGKKVY